MYTKVETPAVSEDVRWNTFSDSTDLIWSEELKKTFVCLGFFPPPFLELQGKETGNMKAMIKRSKNLLAHIRTP